MIFPSSRKLTKILQKIIEELLKNKLGVNTLTEKCKQNIDHCDIYIYFNTS